MFERLHRLMTIVWGTNGIICGLIWSATFVLPSAYREAIPLAPDVHLGVVRGSVVFFNDRDYGPYRREHHRDRGPR